MMIVVLIFGHVLNGCDSYSMNSKWYNISQFLNFMNVTVHLKTILVNLRCAAMFSEAIPLIELVLL